MTDRESSADGRESRVSAGLAWPTWEPGPRPPRRTRDVLWSDVEDIYAAILAHPFLAGLADGTLPRESFRHYIVQDAHYLRGYARALALCARARPPSRRDTVMFAEHAAGAVAAERDLHAALMASWAAARRRPPRSRSPRPPGPTSATCWPRPTAARSPRRWRPCCPATGSTPGSATELLARSSPDPLYARWIAMYGGEEFQAVVDSVLALTDRIGAAASRRRAGADARALHHDRRATSGCSGTPATAGRPGRSDDARAQRRSTESGTTKCSSAPTTVTTIAPRNAGQNPATVERQPEPVGDPADQHEQQRVHHEPDQPQGEHVEQAADHLDQRLEHGVDQSEDQRDADSVPIPRGRRPGRRGRYPARSAWPPTG